MILSRFSNTWNKAGSLGKVAKSSKGRKTAKRRFEFEQRKADERMAEAAKELDKLWMR